MLRKLLFVLSAIALASAAVPSLLMAEEPGRPAVAKARGADPRASKAATPKADEACQKVQLGPMAFCVAQVDGEPALEPKPDVIRFRILVEKGLEDEAEVFTETVDAILGAEDGWSLSGMRFARVSEREDISVVLARPWSVDKLCHPLKTGGTLSCAVMGRANINVERWRKGARTWGKDVAGYRHYLINHEVGHLLGLPHAGCKEKGAPAPIMLPQTKFLGHCTANGDITQRDLDMLGRSLPHLKKRLETKRARQKRSRRTGP